MYYTTVWLCIHWPQSI